MLMALLLVNGNSKYLRVIQKLTQLLRADFHASDNRVRVIYRHDHQLDILAVAFGIDINLLAASLSCAHDRLPVCAQAASHDLAEFSVRIAQCEIQAFKDGDFEALDSGGLNNMDEEIGET